jgi:TonB-dependent receptor
MTGRTSVLWGGMLNLSTRLGGTNRISLNNTVTQSGDNEALSLAGFHNDLVQTLDITRLTFTERRVRSHQLRGEHLIANRHALDWSAALSSVRRVEPDRSDLVYQTTIDASGRSHPYAWFGGSRSATKTFSDVAESGYEGAINYRHQLGSAEQSSALKVGVYYRETDRTADTRAFDILNLGLTDQERRQSAAVIFDGTYAQDGRFFLGANAALGRYAAADRLIAGYLQAEAALGGVRLIGGARVERSRIRVSSTTFDRGDETSILHNTDLLPSLSATIRVGTTQHLRLSASQTLARPEYRELSPTPALDVLGGQSLRGNPDLRRSLIQNLDARWEWYPTPGQVISVALFAKRFEAPIERILVQRAGGGEPEVTFANATAAHNYGVEVELRRNLGSLAPVLAPFSLFANATVMHSNIRPGNDSLSSLTSSSRPMVGQAKYVLNTGLSYTSMGGGVSATVLYNVVGPRIYEAALAPLPDVFEYRRDIIDASLQLPFISGFDLKLDAKNLLDAPVRLFQGDVERHYYRTGRVFSLGLSWQP